MRPHIARKHNNSCITVIRNLKEEKHTIGMTNRLNVKNFCYEMNTYIFRCKESLNIYDNVCENDSI